MATENINDIVSKEAIQQLIDLGKQLSATKAEMDELIASSLELQKNLSNSSNFKDTAKAASDLNAASEKLNQTNSARLNIERQIKASGDEMVNAVRSEEEAMKLLNKVIEENTNNSYEAASNVNRYSAEVSRLKAEQKELKKDLDDGKISLEEYNGRMLDNTVELQQNKKALSDSNKELKNSIAIEESAEGSLRQKAAELSRLKLLYKELTDEEEANAEMGGVLKKAINTLDEELKGLEKSIGENQRSVGNYEVAMQDVLPVQGKLSKFLLSTQKNAKATGKSFGTTLVGGLKSTGKAMLGLLANPLMLALAGIVVLIMGIVKAIKSSEEKMNQLNKVMAPLKAAVDIVLKVLQAVAGVLLNIIEFAMKGVGAVMSLMEKLPFIGDKMKEINDYNREAIQLEEDKASLQKKEREYLVENAKMERDISKFRLDAKDKENLSAEERKKALEAAIDLESKILDNNLEIASEKLRIAKAERKGVEKSKEELDEIAELQADLFKAEEEANTKKREMASELNRTNEEIAKDQKRRIDEYNKKIKEQADFMMSIRKKIAEFEAETDEENLSLKILQLEKQMKEELAKHGKTQTDKIEIQKRYNLEIEKLTKELSTKQAKAEMDALNDILNYTEKINQYRKENTTISNQELTDNLIKIQDQRLSNQIKALEKEKEKELGVLTAGSKEYLAVEEKYNKQSEFLALDNEARKKEIKKKSFDENLTNVKNQFKILENEITTQGIKAGRSEVEIQRELTDQKILLLEKERDALDENLLGREEYALRVSELNKQIALSEKEKADAVIQEINKEKKIRENLRNAIVDGFTSIGNAIAQTIEDEEKRVKIQESLAMAQVLLNEGIAISKATSLAFMGDPYTAIPRLIASTAAIATAMIMSISAINKAKSAYAEGTAFHRGGSALVGEGGQPELVQTPKGETFVVDKPSYFENLPIGTSVTPFSELKYSNSTDMSETNQLLKELNNKPTAVIDVSDKITNYIQTKLGKTAIINRKFKV